MKFRKKHKIDTLSTDCPVKKFFYEYMPITKLGTDRQGSPVTYLKFGAIDTKGMMKVVKYVDIQLYVIDILEKDRAEMKETSEKSEKLVEKSVFIFDFENLPLTTATHKPTLEVFFNLLIMYEANYPESLKTAYAINASYYFSIFWTFVKPFIAGPTLKKIQVFGKTGWKEELLEHISPDVLPEFLGGNRTDPDGNPLCKTFIRQGGPVPESYFTFSNQTMSAKLPGAKQLTVARMSKAGMKVQVLHPGSTLEWEFVVKQRDIGFAVLRRDHLGSDALAVLPLRRVETSEATESGMYKCDRPGTYILEFNNSYSWIHKKDICYKVSVELPNTHTFSP